MHPVFCYWSWISPWQCCFTVYFWIVFCIRTIFTPCHCKLPISVLFCSLWFWLYLLFNIFVIVEMKVGCLGYPGACTGSQLAPRQSNPRNPAMMSPHPGPAGTCHTGLTVEKGERGWEWQRKPCVKYTGSCLWSPTLHVTNQWALDVSMPTQSMPWPPGLLTALLKAPLFMST